MKVSIIVPVYNVRNYIEKCIDSLISQTYSNLEIILVDDGSTDGSEKVCDVFEKKDCRVKVIHKKNGGQSEARNMGLDIASGDYITFVDSDDYVTNNYIEFLLDLLVSNDADISIGSYTYVTSQIVKSRATKEFKILEPHETTRRMLLDDGFDMGVWAKMFKAILFEDIRFPSGKYFEDSLITYQLVAKSKRNIFNSESIYFYVNRNDSTVNEEFSIKKLDLIEMTNEAENFILGMYPDLEVFVQRRVLWAKFSTLNQIITSSNKKEYSELSNNLRQNILKKSSLMKEKVIPKRDKIAFLILKYFGLSIYGKCWTLYLKITR